MSTEQNVAALQQAAEALSRPDTRKRYFDLYHPQCVMHGLPPGSAPGLEGIKQFYRTMFAAFPDVYLTLDDIIAAGDRVAVRYTLSATHSGPFMGVPATGKPVILTGITIMRFVQGTCVERWNNADMFGLVQQISPTQPAREAHQAEGQDETTRVPSHRSDD